MFDNIIPQPITDALQSINNFLESIGAFIGRLGEEMTEFFITVDYYITVATDYVNLVVPPQFTITLGLFLSASLLFRLVGRE